jgi:hypothetical protein
MGNIMVIPIRNVNARLGARPTPAEWCSKMQQDCVLFWQTKQNHEILQADRVPSNCPAQVLGESGITRLL